MKRIVFLDRATVNADLPRPTVPHEWLDHATSTPDEVLSRCHGAHVVVTNKVPLTAATLAALPRLELVVAAATGVDHIDHAACAERGVALANCVGYSTPSVAEHAIALAMALRRNFMGYWRDASAWSQAERFYAELHPVADLHGATLGIVGHGALGRRTAELGAAFGMRVLRAERRGAAEARPGYTDFDMVLREADVLSLHCPLSDETRGLIGADELRAMKRTAILVNTARGALVDEAALLAALDAGWIAGAGLDVLCAEPPPADQPLLRAPRPDLIVTPHIAWRTPTAMARLARHVVAAIDEHYRQSPVFQATAI